MKEKPAPNICRFFALVFISGSFGYFLGLKYSIHSNEWCGWMIMFCTALVTVIITLVEDVKKGAVK